MSYFQAYNFALVVVFVLYRILLIAFIAKSESPPLGVSKSFFTYSAIASGFIYDVVMIAVFAFVVKVIQTLIAAFQQKSSAPADAPRYGRRSVIAALGYLLVLMSILFLTASHFNLLMTMNTPLTYAMLVEFLTVISFGEFLKLMTFFDYAAVFSPLILFGVFRFVPWRVPWAALRLKRLSLWVFLLCAFELMAFVRTGNWEVRLNPVVFLLQDMLQQEKKEAILLPSDQLLVKYDEPWLNQRPIAKSVELKNGRRQPTNVVFIILESTATTYIFDDQKYGQGKIPMPFLHSLKAKSLYASEHYASNNSSPRSLFSIFSGLYESPELRFFSMEKNLRIPHLIDYLGKSYHHFLVTPADLNWYFPKHWFKNRGFTRFFDYNALKAITEYKAGPTAVRDEFQTVDFFIQKMRESPKPFLGVYYTFVAHWPYPDLGVENRIVKPETSMHRYINNLYVQDKLIEKVVTSLHDSGEISNSIVVIVGDHGEAFYQHPGNRVHSSESFNENIKSPLLIYAPAFIKPRLIEHPTNHVDILPTILSALYIPYESKMVQGESLLESAPSRKFSFSYGNENTVSVFSNDLKKTKIIKAKKDCQLFNLRLDPNEQKPMACDLSSEAYKAAELFFREQPRRLKSYNAKMQP